MAEAHTVVDDLLAASLASQGEDMPPDPYHRRTPVRIRPPNEDDTMREVAISATNAMVALAARVNAQDKDLSENTAQLVLVSNKLDSLSEGQLELSRAIRRVARRPSQPEVSEFGVDATPMGGIRVTPEHWQSIIDKLNEQNRQNDLKDARVKGAEEALAKLRQERATSTEELRGSVKFWIGVLTVGAGGIAWMLTHFLHL